MTQAKHIACLLYASQYRQIERDGVRRNMPQTAEFKLVGGKFGKYRWRAVGLVGLC
ncbi:MAG: hypothetical protein HON53_23720 [Planctomycetaceae bacterium]|jgi:hypothetical protein|nr:hypothetical protein [Planctomycetaceae bacterium]MBT6154381.1 hypothetical protein [Planctomycetaceae bacterium]MBT6484088.1 hypothetical protein [Planctomycetaceae bacterium]MBT6496399.1 hypothetical protein [Planctomycetaceae bacterium]